MNQGDQPQTAARPRLGILALLAPGILVAATGVGAGDLATASFAGSHLGVAILWAVAIGAFFKFILNEGLTRWQLATGKTLLEGAILHLGRPVGWIFLPYLLLWSFFVGSALMSACGVATDALIPLFRAPAELRQPLPPGASPEQLAAHAEALNAATLQAAQQGKLVFGIACSILGVLLVRHGGFKLFEIAMHVCMGVMFITVLGSAILLRPDWAAAAKGLFTPIIPDAGKDSVEWTVALMGGVGGTMTILCYGYWIREKGRNSPHWLRACRIDLSVAYIFTALFGMAMVLIGSRLSAEDRTVQVILRLADQFEAPLGPGGRWAFLLGAWAALFTSLLGVWQAVPYLFADFMQLEKQRRAGGKIESIPIDTTGAHYRVYLSLLASVPMIALLPGVSFSNVQKYYSIVGAYFMPLLALTLLILNGRKLWVGPLRNRPLTTLALIATLTFFAWAAIQGWPAS